VIDVPVEDNHSRTTRYARHATTSVTAPYAMRVASRRRADDGAMRRRTSELAFHASELAEISRRIQITARPASSDLPARSRPGAEARHQTRVPSRWFAYLGGKDGQPGAASVRGLAELGSTLNDGDRDLFQSQSRHFGPLVQLCERFCERAMHLFGDHALGFTHLRARFSHLVDRSSPGRGVHTDPSGARFVASQPSRVRRRVTERIGTGTNVAGVGWRSGIGVRVPPRVIRARRP
jgi:hypothetical protein